MDVIWIAVGAFVFLGFTLEAMTGFGGTVIALARCAQLSLLQNDYKINGFSHSLAPTQRFRYALEGGNAATILPTVDLLQRMTNTGMSE